MKKLMYSTLILVSLSVPFLFRTFSLSECRRYKHEKYISSILKSIPFLHDEELQKQLPEPTHAHLAAIQDFLMTFDPSTGNVPRERLRKAYNDLKSNPTKNLINPLQWYGTPSDMGGRTRAIMWDPNDPAGKKVWAGAVTGGLWYRNDITDDNQPWQPVNDFLPSLNISCITYDPNNPQSFYVGTGEAETALIIYRESSGIGDGIWHSADGGQTWNLLESTTGFKYITDIVVRDENGVSVIYAGVVSGIYKGSVHYSNPSDGLFRSEDGGITWEQVLPDIPGYGLPYAVADIELGADGRIYVGTMQNIDLKGGAVILYSDSGLPGSWTVYDNYVQIIQNHPTYNVPGRVIIAAAPSNPNIVYAQIAAGNSSFFVYYRGRYILKSTNRGQTWTAVSIPSSEWSTLAWHAFALKVDPNNPNRIYTGGLDMWKSINGGSSWTKISDWSLMYYGGGDQYLHADHHDIQFKPGSSNVFITCNDGGVFYTETATADYPVFLEKNHGFNTLQYYTCAIHPQNGSNIYVGGLQDNGTLLYTGQPLTINEMISGGDGAACFFDDDVPLLLTSIYYNRYYVFLNLNYQYSLDYNSGVFINPADFDRKNNSLYANAVSFSGGNANTLLRISNIPNSNNASFIGLNTNTQVYFSHVKVSPHSPANNSTLFVGTQSGRVYKIINASTTPQTIEITSDNFPEAYVSCIAVGSSDDNLLVTFSNYGVPSVWHTINGGLTWRNVEGNLPDIPIRWAIFHPLNDHQVMLATELGIWTTNAIHDENVIWVQDIEGLPSVRVDMLSIRNTDNIVLAATHGRGLFTAYYPPDPAATVINIHHPSLTIFPNPTRGLVHIQIPDFFNDGQVFLTLTDINIRNVIKKQRIDQSLITLDLSGLPEGIYVVTIETNNRRLSEKLILR